MWEVLRHGGLGAHAWRPVLRTADEKRARVRFEREQTRMKQGGVQLRDPFGQPVLQTWLPSCGHKRQVSDLRENLWSYQ